MRKNIMLLFLALLSAVAVRSQEIAGYEYWIDDNFEGRTVVTGNSTDINLDIDVSGLLDGMHYFCFRAKDTTGKYSGITTQYFYKPSSYESNSLASYEYWIDDNFEGRKSVAGTDGIVNLEIDTEDMLDGMHYFCFRAKDTTGKYSGITTQYFYKPRSYENNSLAGYEYWIDDNFENRVSVNSTDGIVNLEIDTESMLKGMHYLCFRAKDANGHYGGISTQYFFNRKITEGGPLVRYALSFDDMAADTVAIDSTMSLVWTDKWIDVPQAEHISDLGSVTSVAVSEGDGDGASSDSLMLKVTAENQRTMTLAFADKGGRWIATKDTFVHVSEHDVKAAPMKANYVYRIDEGNATFAKYIRAKAGTLGLKSDRPCALSVYNATERVAQLDADSLAQGVFLDIPADGVYYFVMQNKPEVNTPQSELKLVCVNDPLPSPLHVDEAGTLADLFTFTDEKLVENLTLTGEINGGDFSEMGLMDNMRTLNLKDVSIRKGGDENSGYHTLNDTIAGNVFGGMESLEELQLPASVKHVDDNAFSGTGDHLLIVNWNSAAEVRSEAFDADMGNCLIFVPAGTTVNYDGNVIVDGMAERIVLTDGRPLRNPENFRARNIVYTRHFDKHTQPHVPGGWESLVLPFDVHTVWSEEKNSELAPFNSGTVGARPFWLGELTENGYSHADAIKAGVPYIISMPNSEAYEDEFNITGNVLFMAEADTGVVVSATTEGIKVRGADYYLVPAYEVMQQSDTLYVINHDEHNGNAPGSAFVAGLRDVRPFEAYALSVEGAGAKHRMYLIGTGQTTGIENLYRNAEDDIQVYSEGGTLCIVAPKNMNIALYSADGRLVRMMNLHQGLNKEYGLPRGVYFVGKKKVSLSF